MLKRILQKTGILLLSLLASLLLVYSIPIVNVLVKGEWHGEKKYTKTEVRIVKNDIKPPPPKPQQPTRKPNRANPTSRSPQAGPRFAMDLDVVGGSQGASVPADIIAKQSGGGSQGQGDVDQKPTSRTPPSFQPPASIREKEIDATLRLSFCVDVSGRPYDIRVVEETPTGMGLATAGIEALSRTTFQPARKGGTAVPFCGLEQPFEIHFKD